MEFIPGNSQIWVSKLSPDDPIYEYDTEEKAMDKAVELKENDNTERKYRVSPVITK